MGLRQKGQATGSNRCNPLECELGVAPTHPKALLRHHVVLRILLPTPGLP
uniref:Uncharacterized protein n=1 Tax=viral metagenome TaxID=1070528 RepID=A0A6M3JZX7_9ZZZZ